MFSGYYNSISAEIFGRPQGRQLKAPTKSWMCNNVSHVCCFAVAIPQPTMEQVCEKNATKCCTKNQDITAEGNSLFALDVNCCFQFKMTTNAIRMGWRTRVCTHFCNCYSSQANLLSRDSPKQFDSRSYNTTICWSWTDQDDSEMILAKSPRQLNN